LCEFQFGKKEILLAYPLVLRICDKQKLFVHVFFFSLKKILKITAEKIEKKFAGLPSALALGDLKKTIKKKESHRILKFMKFPNWTPSPNDWKEK
jgi:hypothetical protein